MNIIMKGLMAATMLGGLGGMAQAQDTMQQTAPVPTDPMPTDPAAPLDPLDPNGTMPVPGTGAMPPSTTTTTPMEPVPTPPMTDSPEAPLPTPDETVTEGNTVPDDTLDGTTAPPLDDTTGDAADMATPLPQP